jgi:DNA-binding transcriptional MerR regulator
MATLTTGEIAEQTDVNVHTVRYYEEEDLLPPVPRSAGGHRQFDEEHVSHIRFIKRAQQLGFTLREIRELLALRAAPDAGADVRTKTKEKIEEVEAKIQDLRRIRDTLEELAAACDADEKAREECRVLHALNGEQDPSW